MNKDFEKIAIMAGSVVGLACLLTYTGVHTGTLLARYVRPSFVGWLCAFGIETMIALLAWRYARAEHRTKSLIFALFAALAVSALANIAEGFHAFYGEPLTVVNGQQVDMIQIVVGLSATGLISFLVFALSDIVALDSLPVRPVAAQPKPDPARTNNEPTRTEPEPIDYKTAIFAALDEQPERTPTELAELVGCAKSTASKWASKWTNGVQQ